MIDVLKHIPLYPHWTKIEPILKGWSDDKKFYIEDHLGNKLLLRITDISKYNQKKLEYEYMINLTKVGINMNIPLDFGTCENHLYTLYRWIDGKDAKEEILKLSEKEQFNLGLLAGKILRKIHSLPALKDQEEWEIIYKQKINKKIKQYQDCSITLPNDDAFIKYIKKNLHYLDNRPQSFQHGDYHLGNLLITKENQIAVIDFNRSDFGDPWEEFNRITLSYRVSIPFANGQIKGYFDSEVPDEFFRLLALYQAVNVISSIPWAILFGDSEVEFMIQNAKAIYDSYDGFNSYIPNWYSK